MPEVVSREDALAQGLKRYFTGEPCAKGHVSQRYSKGKACVACLLAHEAAVRADPEKGKKYRIRKSANQKKLAAKKKAESREYADRYKAYCRAYHRERRANDPDFAARKYAKSREWFKANPEAARVFASNRRKSKRAGNGFSRQDVKYCLRRQGNRCAEPSCRVVLEKYHVDHVMPLSLGGAHDKTNIQCLCVSCNLQKAAKHPIDWAQQRGRLL